jgi:hypothetical protein
MGSELPPIPEGGAEGPGHGPGERMRLFESLLKRDVEIRCDFDKIGKALFERIQKAEAMGPLSALQAEAQPPPGFFDKVEAGLLERIRDHREYEQPVNDIIAGQVKPADAEARRVEDRLDGRIRAAARLEPWERGLKADVPLPMGRWEALEEKLFTRIDQHRRLALLTPAPFWLGLGLSLRRPAVLASGLILAVAALVGGLAFFHGEPAQPLRTLVYQAQGASVGDLAAAFAQDRPSQAAGVDVRSREDGALILVNRRGFVEMRDGSSLRIEQADAKRVGYRVGFAEGSGNRGGPGGGSPRGNVTFFVNKRKGNEKYQVATPDYRIEVVGTYFRVQPDAAGRVSTAVLEGKVKIHSEAYGEFEVAAGQSLAYDPAAGRYRVRDGGTSMRREDIETVPNVDDLGRYGALVVTSDARGAQGGAMPMTEVRIDGKYKGAAPLVVLLPPGRHDVRLSREGFAAMDTSILMAQAGARLAVALRPEPAAPVAFGRPAKHKASAVPPKPSAAGAASVTSASPALSRAEEADLMYRKADELQDRDWQTAVNLYRQMLENPAAAPLRREAALFSIARLRADHEKDKAPAKADFTRYLAAYPDGAFAGESWLRLAELEVAGDQGRAIGYYLKAIAKLPRHPRLSELQHRVGLLYLQNKRYDEAVALFRQSLGNILSADESGKRKVYQSLYRALVAKGDRKGAEAIAPEYRPPDSADGIR